MVNCDFQGPEFRGSAAISARTAPHAFFLFRSGTYQTDPLVRSLNHGLTYLFPRAISAVVLAKVIIASASGIIHVLLTVSRTAYRGAGKERRSSEIRGRDHRSLAASSPASVTTHTCGSHFENASDFPPYFASNRGRQSATAAGQSGLIGGLIIYEACFIHSLKFPRASAKDHYDVIMS